MVHCLFGFNFPQLREVNLSEIHEILQMILRKEACFESEACAKLLVLLLIINNYNVVGSELI